jgi:hypothetical protein
LKCVLCVALVAAAAWAGRAVGLWKSVSGKAVEPLLAVAADRLDFGEVWETDAFTWVLPIENRQGHDVEIQDFATSCTCLAVERA